MNEDQLRQADITSAARWYCEQGLAIVPLIGKRPAYGDDWWTRAITDPNEATMEFASDSRYTNIGWCQGYGTIAIDVDEPELLTDDIRTAIRPGALNLTRRNPDRGHRIFATSGDWSASTVGFPQRGWGEVRAHGGQIVIWGPHPVTDGFYLYDATQELPLLPASVEAWLTPREDYSGPATDDEVRHFLDGHTTLREDTRESPNGVVRWLHEQEAAGVGLHELLLSGLCWAFRESRQGHYPAQTGYDAVQEWWGDAWRRRAGDTTGERTTPSRGEWEGAVRWAIGQAMLEPEHIEAEPAVVERDPDEVAIDWTPADLGPLLDGELEPSPTPYLFDAGDGEGLFYAGSINCLFGDSGSGKSWIAAEAARQELDMGGVVLWIDLEQTLHQTVERMRALGTDDALLREGFLRIAPRDDIRRDIHRAIELCDERGVSLVVLDSLGEAFAIDGVNENNDDEVGPWQRDVLRPLTDDTETHAGVLVIDHATKAKEAPLFPSGSKRKRAGWTGAGYLIESAGFSKSEAGWVDVQVAKDRHGARPAGTLASKLHVQPGMGGALSITATLPPPEEAEPATRIEDSKERREMVREAVLAIHAMLTADGLEQVDNATARALVPRGSGQVRTAVLALAVSHGWLEQDTGLRGAKVFSVNDVPPADWVLGGSKSPGSEGF